jgi:hypothetical protein
MPIEQVYVAQLPYGEIYRRLGYTQATQVPAETKNKIDITIQTAATLCKPHAVSKIVSLGSLHEITTKSKDLAKFLNKFQEVILFGVTIGPELIAKRDELLHTDPATGVIYDAVGSELVEEALNIYQNKLRITLRREGKNLSTARFSPGYGDCDITVQDIFFKVLPMAQLGVTLTPTYIMRPEKTITAFAGISC